MSERNPDSGQPPTLNEYAYMVFCHENELLLTTTSAVEALEESELGALAHVLDDAPVSPQGAL